MTPNDRYKITGETRELQTRRHWAVLLGPGSLTLAVVLVAFMLSPVGEPTGASGLLWWLVVPFLGYFAFKVADWWVDIITVTDKRVFVVSGLIVRKVAMMPLARITDLTYDRSVLGRLLGYGELILESAGQDQALTNVNYLPNPDEFYETVTSLTLPQKASQLPPKEYWDALLDAVRDRPSGSGSRDGRG